MRIVPSLLLTLSAAAACCAVSAACTKSNDDTPPADASPDADAAGDAADENDQPVDAGPDGPVYDTHVIQVATGGHHTCAIAADHYLWCFGSNVAGELGLGKSDGNIHAPALVPGISDVQAIALGAHHTCALTGDNGGNKVFCWGLNAQHQLGHDSSIDTTTCSVDGASVPCNTSPTAVKVAGVLFSNVAAGGAHSLAITSRKEIYTWGSNALGQLGRVADLTCGAGASASPCSATPAVVPGLSSVSSVAGGGDQSYAIALGGDASAPITWVWGGNGHGELGIGAADATRHETPAPNGDQAAVRVGAGTSHGCRAASDGTLACWGADDFGQLSLAADGGAPDDGGTPIVASPRASAATDVGSFALGGAHSCAVTRGRQVRCWGRNTLGQLGHDPALDSRKGDDPYGPAPVDVTTMTTVVQIAAGGDVTCAVKVDGSLWCWGANESQQLGHDPAADTTCGVVRCSFTPRPVPGIGTSYGGGGGY